MDDDDDVRRLALPLEQPADLDPLLERIGDARFVQAMIRGGPASWNVRDRHMAECLDLDPIRPTGPPVGELQTWPVGQ